MEVSFSKLERDSSRSPSNLLFSGISSLTRKEPIRDRLQPYYGITVAHKNSIQSMGRREASLILYPLPPHLYVGVTEEERDKTKILLEI